MNMFKRGRKAKEQAHNEAFDPHTRAGSPPSTFKHTKMSRQKKKIVIEQRPTIDLENALPDMNDFRTSLLMPGLSARFSMLREQDDPNSKLGKASDDSVLFPKRVSRLNLFGHDNPLTDIAEVESIHSGFKPPFADRERSNSYSGEGYESDSGSVMSRARRAEGTVHFGGRQQVFKIPSSSTKLSPEGDPGYSVGKQTSENETPLSLFQQYRLREREQTYSGEESRHSQATEADGSEGVQSQSASFSKNRGTQSSTNSAQSNLRASTAATSVVSESPAARNSNSTAITASSKCTSDSVNTTADSPHQTASPNLRRLRDESSQPLRQLSQSKSAANMRDRIQRNGGFFSGGGFNGTSSPTSAGVAQPLDFGFGEDKSIPSPSYMLTEPSAPQADENVLASSVQPNDRGKATALGLFNKPAKEFDEQQFLQRQLQMHEGRNSPHSVNSRAASRASEEAHRGSQQETSTRISASSVTSHRVSTPQVPPIPDDAALSTTNSRRISQSSNGSTSLRTPPRPKPRTSASATAKDNVKARVESLIRRQNAELAALEAEKMGSMENGSIKPSISTEDKEITSTFFDNDDASSDNDSEAINEQQSSMSNVRLPSGDIHPAFRNSTTLSHRSAHSELSKTRSMVENDSVESDQTRNNSIEGDFHMSDIQNTGLGLGLSGLIRTHLRHDSDRSSILPPVSPTLPPFPADRPRDVSIPNTAKTTAESVRSEPFDLDTTRFLATGTPTVTGPPSPNTVMSQKAQQMLDQAMALKAASENTKQLDTAATDAASTEISSTDRHWYDDRAPSHRRGESSETTKERREFDEELAERRRRIQEGLKSVTERDRSISPAPTPRGRDLTMQAFAQPSSDSAYVETQSKAMTILGLEPNNAPPSRPVIESRSSDENRGRNAGVNHEYRGPLQDMGPLHNRKIRMPRQDVSDNVQPPRSVTPSSGIQGRRARSNSAADDRTKGRSRPLDELRPPMPGGFPSSSTYISQPTSPMPRQYGGSSESPPDHRSNNDRSASATEFRNGYLASPPISDINNGYFSRSSPRASPMLPPSPYMTSHNIGQASPRQPSYNNGRNTPTSNGRATPSGGRKRSGTKTTISEPTFISSTSSVTLIPLPHPGSPDAPPLPEMNPRRRGTTSGDRPHPTLNLTQSSRTPLATVPASPRFPDLEFRQAMADTDPLIRSRNRLRKSSSEGGNMAAKARQQALMAEIEHEKSRSPAIPVFPNRSATALGLSNDGGMF